MKKAKRSVIDANTLISAFLLHRNSIPAQAYYKASGFTGASSFSGYSYPKCL
jgi:hypothetical protein